MATDEDIFSSENIQDPYALYERLRKKHQAAIVWSSKNNVWVVLDFDLVKKISLDPETFSSRNSIWGDSAKVMNADNIDMLITMDGENHNRARKLLLTAFKTQEVEAYVPVVRKIVAKQLQYIFDQPQFLAVSDLAVPIPIKVICEILGIKYDEQKVKYIKEKTDEAVGWLGHTGNDRFQPLEEKFIETRKFELPQFIYSEIQEKKEHPGSDLLTRVLTEEMEIDGEKRKLNEMEIVINTLMLLFAGNITTTNLIGQSLAYLANNMQLSANASRDLSLVDKIVEETLRFEAPAQATYRVATKDTELGDVQITAGQQLLLSWAAAGRDPKKYSCPHQYAANRTADHISFGIGKHYCIGAKLARMEAQVTLKEIFNQLESFSLAPDYKIEYNDTPLFRGPKELVLDYKLKK